MTRLEQAAEAIARYAQGFGPTYGVTSFTIVVRSSEELVVASDKQDPSDDLAAAMVTLQPRTRPA